ncbi:MAG: class I SAM-dependent methyltransferase [Phycisphaerales bacterium]
MDGPLYSKEPADPRLYQVRFDTFYTRTARLYDFGVKVLPVWKTWLRQALPFIQGPRVLEVSFGTGYFLTQYASRFETHGIDYNARMVAIARRNLAKRGMSADLREGNVEELPYEDGYFGTVTNTMALSGYPDGQRAMSQMRRVLKPGGRLVLIDVNYPTDRNWLGMRLTRCWQHFGDVVRDVGRLLAEHGFEYQDTEIGGFGSIHMYICHRS